MWFPKFSELSSRSLCSSNVSRMWLMPHDCPNDSQGFLQRAVHVIVPYACIVSFRNDMP